MATLHPPGPALSTKRRVLVVEDNLDSVHSMAVLVKMMGHEVQFAINGFAALAVAREFRPHIVLLDLGLPDFNGCEIARQLRFEEPLRHTRFIAISALPPSRTGSSHSRPDATRSIRSRSIRRCSSGCWEMQRRNADESGTQSRY